MSAGNRLASSPVTTRQIEDAKLTLDGARAILRDYPTALNQDVVDTCEEHLNDLLDQYPRSASARQNRN